MQLIGALGCRQAVRHRTLTPAVASSNLASPVKKTGCRSETVKTGLFCQNISLHYRTVYVSRERRRRDSDSAFEHQFPYWIVVARAADVLASSSNSTNFREKSIAVPMPRLVMMLPS